MNGNRCPIDMLNLFHVTGNSKEEESINASAKSMDYLKLQLTDSQNFSLQYAIRRRG